MIGYVVKVGNYLVAHEHVLSASSFLFHKYRTNLTPKLLDNLLLLLNARKSWLAIAIQKETQTQDVQHILQIKVLHFSARIAAASRICLNISKCSTAAEQLLRDFSALRRRQVCFLFHFLIKPSVQQGGRGGEDGGLEGSFGANRKRLLLIARQFLSSISLRRAVLRPRQELLAISFK